MRTLEHLIFLSAVGAALGLVLAVVSRGVWRLIQSRLAAMRKAPAPLSRESSSPRVHRVTAVTDELASVKAADESNDTEQ